MLQKIFQHLKFSAFFLLVCTTAALGQTWQLEKEVEGVEIFTRIVEGSDLKELKLEFYLDLNLAPIVHLLHDVQDYTNWVYNSLAFEAVSSNAPGNGYFYGIVDFPWPLDDRDYVIHTVTKQDVSTNIVTIESKSIEHEAKKCTSKYVRIPRHHNRWTLTPLEKNKTKLEYWLKTDPGGNLPDGIINMAIDKGSLQTVLNMKTKLANCNSDLKLAYIKER